MKKGILILLIILVCLQPIFATDYTPYSVDEFPQWSIKLRRAETLMFGSFPITFGFTTLSYSLARSFGAGQLSQDPFRETVTLLGVAGGLSIMVALADYIIGEMQD